MQDHPAHRIVLHAGSFYTFLCSISLILQFKCSLWMAPLALVSIVLPNLYFRLMLWADVTEDSANIYEDYDTEL